MSLHFSARFSKIILGYCDLQDGIYWAWFFLHDPEIQFIFCHKNQLFFLGDYYLALIRSAPGTKIIFSFKRSNSSDCETVLRMKFNFTKKRLNAINFNANMRSKSNWMIKERMNRVHSLRRNEIRQIRVGCTGRHSYRFVKVSKLSLRYHVGNRFFSIIRDRIVHAWFSSLDVHKQLVTFVL